MGTSHGMAGESLADDGWSLEPPRARPARTGHRTRRATWTGQVGQQGLQLCFPCLRRPGLGWRLL